MKTIILKTIQTEGGGTLSYRRQILEIVKTPMDGASASIEEVRRSIRIMDALDAQPGDELRLEDSDHAYLVERVNNARWTMADRAIVVFTNDIVEAT